MWFTPNPKIASPFTESGTTEVLIWLDAQGFSETFYRLIYPLPQFEIGTFNSSGVVYDVYCHYIPTTSEGLRNRIDFIPSHLGNTAANINILNFVGYLENPNNFKYTSCNGGYPPLTPSWYLRQIPVGFEIYNGGVGLAVDSFSESIIPKARLLVFVPPNVVISGNLSAANTISVNAIWYYIPVNVFNSQSAAIASGTQFAITFNAIKYSYLGLNSNLSNICVAYESKCITTWIQGTGIDPLLPDSYVIWVKAQSAIGAGETSHDYSVIVFDKGINNYQDANILGAGLASAGTFKFILRL